MRKQTSNGLQVDEPWLEMIRTGLKRVEGRVGPISRFEEWVGSPAQLYSSEQTLRVMVVAVRHYDNLYDYLAGEDWSVVAPHLDSLEEVIRGYHEFYSDEEIERRGGMNAIAVVPLGVL